MSSQSHIILAASPIMMMTMRKIIVIVMVILMIIWTIMVIITVRIMIMTIVPRTSGKDAKALVKESDRIVGYKSLSTIYCYYTTTRYLFLLYGGNISYNIILCCMVERYYIYVIWWTALVER